MVIKLGSNIYLKSWLALKPYEKQAPTDKYYLKICNKVKRVVGKSLLSSLLPVYLSKEDFSEELNILACFLTSYFEDLISQTNLWLAFVNKHQAMYGKLLPFYNTEAYEEGEINQPDVCFLIWYFLNTIQDENYIEPLNKFITDAAQKVMEIFEDEWEVAPENDVLLSFYRLDETEEDYYVVKSYIESILFKSYLFHTDTYFKLLNKEQSLMEEKEELEDFDLYIYDLHTNYGNTARTQLLSLSGKEWAAAILGEQHPLSAALLIMSVRLAGLFLYKGQDDACIHIEHIASGKKFAVTKNSMKGSHVLKKVDNILFMGIVKWKDEWWFSGVLFQQAFNADIVLDEKNSTINRKAVNFLDASNQAQQSVQKYLKNFLQFNEGNQIAFLPVEQIDDFVSNFVEYHNKAMRLSANKIEETPEQNSKNGYLKENKKMDFFSEKYKDSTDEGLVFLNPKSGLEMAIGINSAFPLPNNPNFNAEESDDNVFSLLEDKQFSTELAMFCLEHCKDDLPFFNYGLGNRYLEDIDFLLRFWKAEAYHSTPNVTLLNNKENVIT